MTGAKNNILEAVGGTPIVKLQKLARHVAADIYVKCEYLNPGGLDEGPGRAQHRRRRRAARAARARRHDRRGDQRQHRHGPGAGGGGARLHVRLRHARQDVAGEGRRRCARSARAWSSARPPSSPTIRAATTRSPSASSQETPGAFYANQYHNPANPEAHYISTAPEIWEQTGGEVDVFVAGHGHGRHDLRLRHASSRRRSPASGWSASIPIGSLYYEYVKTGRMTRPFSYYVEGIGEDFLPSHDEPQDRRRDRARRRQGVLPDDARAGAPGGPLRRRQLGRGGGRRHQVRRGRRKRKENILVLLPDGASKYLSKIFDDKWMRENGFLDEPDPLGTVAELLRAQEAAPAHHRARRATRSAR